MAEVERRIVLMRVEPDSIPGAPGEGSIMTLDHPFTSHSSDWRVVSHSINFNLDGALILSVLMEAPKGTAPPKETLLP